jgi:hypothetical protein
VQRTRPDADVVNGDDVGVVEGCRSLRFLLKAAHEVGLLCEGLRQDLQRDIALQPRIARAIDLAHTTAANQRDDFVGANARTWRERHRVSGGL